MQYLRIQNPWHSPLSDEPERGLKEDDMDMIAECIALVLQSEDNIEKVKGMVAELTAKYPLDM